MTLNLVNPVGDANPQLFRELKGRLIPRNILIAVVISLLGQLLLLISFSSGLPRVDQTTSPVMNRYCTGMSQKYSLPACMPDGFGSFTINWQLWWQDVFIWLSLIGMFALLVIGSYLLITDLSKEERQGTLNFLRLSPGSSVGILGGKLFGVPILLYLVAILALPLHLLSGLSAHIPFSQILSFDAVLMASCLFFYSVALLVGLVGNWLGGFQAWLGGGTVLLFLFIVTQWLFHSSTTNTPMDWLVLFNPAILLPYLIDSLHLSSDKPLSPESVELLWFSLPVGANSLNLAGFMIVNYGVWSYWLWQGLKRCFHNPTMTLLSKRQSYPLTACFEVVLLGFALNPQSSYPRNYSEVLFNQYQMVLVLNLLLFLVLIVALSPHRQGLQDWARYRHQHQASRKRGIISDLIWGKKSPGVVALGMNLAIASTIMLPWLLFWPTSEYKAVALFLLLVNASMLLVYTTIAQLMLLMKTPKRAVWAASIVGGLILFPTFVFPILFNFLSVSSPVRAIVWLFSAFPSIGITGAGISTIANSSIILVIVAQSLSVVFLNVFLMRRLQKMGESATKALLSPHPVIN